MESYSKSNGIITDEEALEQLRKGLYDVLRPDVTDSVLMKWLRTNNYNIEKVIHLYKEYTWAKLVYQTDDVDKYKMPEVLQRYRFNATIGNAKDGSPIVYIYVGGGDFKGFVASLDVVDICKYGSYVIENDLKRCQEQSKKLGKEINSITYIADFANFSIRQVLAPGMIELGFDMFKILQDHYPEIWNHILVINVPYYFETLYKIFKPCLRHTFIQKIHLASKDSNVDLLLKFIDPEVLPAFLGGKRVDSYGNPKCEEFIHFGGTISPEYCKKFKISPSEPGAVDVWLPPRTCYNALFSVREASSIIVTEFHSERGSVKMRLLYREFSEDAEKYLDLSSTTEYLDDSCNGSWKGISPTTHVPAHIVPLNNHCIAPWPGIYALRFDNTGSWLSGRRIIFRNTVLPPGTKPNSKYLQNG